MDEIATIARSQIEGRIAELEKERDGVIAQANNQISAYNGAIGELQRLLAPIAAPTQETALVSPNGARPIEEKTEVA